MDSYIHGPVPTGFEVSSSSVALVGTTLISDRRSFTSENGKAVVMVTVVSSLASMLAIQDSIGTYRPPSAVARFQEETTSAAVTAVPSENLAPSRSVTS